MSQDYQPCHRCGRVTCFKRANPGVCGDCLSADPWWVQATSLALVEDARRLRARGEWLAARRLGFDTRPRNHGRAS